jgi:hypothetical protein
VQWIPLGSAVGGLGVGSAIGTWFGAGRARREVRSDVLKALATTESKRWAEDPDSHDYPEFVTAVRGLETAALIARLPRRAVLHYVVLADAARHLSGDSVDYLPAENDFWGPIDGRFDTLVRDAAEVLTGLTWRPW